MTLARMIVILLGALLLMLAVVVLRAETTRLHYQLSQIDQQADLLWQELREEELELQRLRNPAVLRARVAEMWMQPDDAGKATPRPRGPR